MFLGGNVICSHGMSLSTQVHIQGTLDFMSWIISIFGVILNPALNGLMSLVSFNYFWVILFSTNYTMDINKDV